MLICLLLILIQKGCEGLEGRGGRGGSHISKRSLSQSSDRMVDVSGAMGRTWVCREEEGDKKRELSVEL